MPPRVTTAFVHWLVTSGALPRLRTTVDYLLSADTIENETTIVSAGPEIAKGVQKVLSKK